MSWLHRRNGGSKWLLQTRAPAEAHAHGHGSCFQKAKDKAHLAHALAPGSADPKAQGPRR